MKAWIRDFGYEHKMTLVVKKSDKKGRNPRVVYSCERSGKYKPKTKSVTPLTEEEKKKKKKNTGTRKCDCPFEVKFIKKQGTEDCWMLDFVKCGVHNHTLSPYIEGHAQHSKLKPEELSMFANLNKGGVKPKTALGIIKEKYPANCSSLQTLYNVRKKLIKESQDGRTEFQQINKEAVELGYIVRDRRDYETDIVEDFFFAHPDSISLAKCFPHVFAIDCTYKTNQYGWPLFEIVGMTSTGQTFPVCYCFMKQETEEHYNWALKCFKDLLGDNQVPSAIVTDKDQACMNAVEEVFPNTYHLLCRWHIKMGIEKKGKSILPKEEDEKKDGNEVQVPDGIEGGKGWQAKLKNKWNDMWDDVVWSKTEESYQANLLALEESFKHWPALCEYVRNTWLQFKEKFVSVWTDHVFHLGNTSSNRVEGAHNTLKGALLRNSRHSFLSMFYAIKNSMGIVVSEIKKQFTMSLNIQSISVHQQFFKNVKGITSNTCLKLLREEFDKSNRGFTEGDVCNCSMLQTHGLPCACRIGALLYQGKCLELLDVHDFWKKLSVVPRRVEFDELELHEEFQMWVTTYKNSSSDQKRYMLRRLREDSSKQTTWLNTPIVPNQGKGRPTGSKTSKRKKVDHSTKREPSSFEREEPDIPFAPSGQHFSLGTQSSQASIGSQSSKMAVQKKKPPKKKARLESGMMLYKEYIPKGYEKYVDDIVNVDGDGNCGFRATAVALGMDEDEGWVQVRKDCIMELDNNQDLYGRMFGGAERVAELRESMDSFISPNLTTKKYWMTMPETGYIISNIYSKILVYMVELPHHKLFCSFVPQLTSSPPLVPGEPVVLPIISLMYTPDHFVCVKLKPFSPIPPPTPFWSRFKNPGVLGWDILMDMPCSNFRSEFAERFCTKDELILLDDRF